MSFNNHFVYDVFFSLANTTGIFVTREHYTMPRIDCKDRIKSYKHFEFPSSGVVECYTLTSLCSPSELRTISSQKKPQTRSSSNELAIQTQQVTRLVNCKDFENKKPQLLTLVTHPKEGQTIFSEFAQDHTGKMLWLKWHNQQGEF